MGPPSVTSRDESEEADNETINAFLSKVGNFGAEDTLDYGDTVPKDDKAIDYGDIEISDDELPVDDSASRQDDEDHGDDQDMDHMLDLDHFDPRIEELFEGRAEPDDLDNIEVEPEPGEAYRNIEIPMGGTNELDRLFPHDTHLGEDDEEPDPTPIESAMQLFPDFKPHERLSFSTLFKPKPGSLDLKAAKIPRPLVPGLSKVQIELAQDDKLIYDKKPTKFEKAAQEKASALRKRDIVDIHLAVSETESEDEKQLEADKKDWENDGRLSRDIDLAANGNWEEQIETMMLTPPPTPTLTTLMPDEDEEEWEKDFRRIEEENLEVERSRKRLKLDIVQSYLDNLPTWLDDDAILEGNLSALAARPILDMNDPHILLDVRQPHEMRQKRKIGGEFRRRANKDLSQRYNISNDEAYEALKDNHRDKVRSQISQLSIEHTMPALRLQSPYYKTKLSVKEARSYHRPTITFQLDQEIRFNRMKYLKKKAYKGKSINEIFKSTKDMSLGDGTNFVLLEYSEEYPMVMSNFGMGSRLINYYRQKSPDDNWRPKAEIGDPQILQAKDRSPFWNFGEIEPGETVLTLYNRMIRAPVFHQESKKTDFLVIRSTSNTASHYYLRTIPHVYVVGQLFPVTEVPGPHSRKVTTASKNRLKMISYRIIKKKPERALAVKDLVPHFPEHSEMQTRQRMKDLLKYQKDTGLWELTPGTELPDEPGIRSMVKPEDVCLLEAMQVGVRHLEDCGYTKPLDDNDEKDQGSIEQQLTPWNASKNFINATQGKAMLQLHGEGDPSGRGEAFSFAKISMKGGFRDIGASIDDKMDKQKQLGGHAYNVNLQEAQYTAAIQRIWRAQHKSLSSREEFLDIDMADSERDEQEHDELFEPVDMRTPRSEAAPGLFGADDEAASQFSRMSAKTQKSKILKITRRKRNAHGEVEVYDEIINDPKVIKMYIQKRRDKEAENLQLEFLRPTGDADKDDYHKSLLKKELARLEKNIDRRIGRNKQAKNSMTTEMSPDEMSPRSPLTTSASYGTNNKKTTRRCANCGMAGHIKTNRRECPVLNSTIPQVGLENGTLETPTSASNLGD